MKTISTRDNPSEPNSYIITTKIDDVTVNITYIDRDEFDSLCDHTAPKISKTIHTPCKDKTMRHSFSPILCALSDAIDATIAQRLGMPADTGLADIEPHVIPGSEQAIMLQVAHSLDSLQGLLMKCNTIPLKP